MLRVDGPRAAEFVALLSRYSGEPWQLNGNEVQPGGVVGQPALPRTSSILANVIRKIVAPGRVVVAHLFRDPAAGGLVDTFFGHADPTAPASLRHHRPRSVFVGHLLAIEALRFEMAVALTGHVLAEYASAAGLNVQTVGQFLPHHRIGLIVEATINHELTGRPISSNPSDTMFLSGGGVVLRKQYGPGNTYDVRFGPPPLNHVLAVTRSNV